MISKSKNNLWKWTQSADYPCVHAELIKPIKICEIEVDEQHNLTFVTSAGRRFPNRRLTGHVEIIVGNFKKIFSKALEENKTKVHSSEWIEPLIRRIDWKQHISKLNPAFTAKDHFLRARCRLDLTGFDHIIGTTMFSVDFNPQFRNLRMREFKGDTIITCDVYSEVNGEDVLMSSNLDLKVKEWGKIVSCYPQDIDIQPQILIPDLEKIWYGNRNLISTILSIKTAKALQADGRIEDKLLNIEIKDVAIVEKKGTSNLFDSKVHVQFEIMIYDEQNNIIGSPLRGDEVSVSVKQWNDFIDTAWATIPNLSIKIKSFEEQKFSGMLPMGRGWVERAFKFKDDNKIDSEDGEVLDQSKVRRIVGFKERQPNSIRRSRRRKDEPFDPFQPNASQKARERKENQNSSRQSRYRNQGDAAMNEWAMQKLKSQRENNAIRSSLSREERLAQLRAKSAATAQFVKESKEAKSGSTKTTTKSTNRKRRSKIVNNTTPNSSRHKHKNPRHNSGRNKKRSKKNSSPLGDALNDLKRARKDEENAKKNQGKRQQRAAKLEVARCQRIVDNLKKSNK